MAAPRWHVAFARNILNQSATCGSSSSGAVRRRAAATRVEVSPERLQEFLNAEIQYLGKGAYSQITIPQILKHRTPVEVAALIHKELPPRFATRIRQIESVAQNWQELPGMRELHEIATESFMKLRLAEVEPDLTEFTEVVKDLRKRHKPVVTSLARAANSLRQAGELNNSRIHDWINNIMKSRMGTEMLTLHYMELLADNDDNHIGIVDIKCDPERICQEAITRVRELYSDVDLDITVQTERMVETQNMQFSFISRYLFFIVEELLKNSVCASLACGPGPGGTPRNITLTVCEDSKRIGIRISDSGGGVASEHTDRIWEYMYTSTPDELQMKNYETTPLYGPGMGLPLCNLYTHYLGGSLHLMSMPGIGTDVYVYLNRIDADIPSRLNRPPHKA